MMTTTIAAAHAVRAAATTMTMTTVVDAVAGVAAGSVIRRAIRAPLESVGRRR
jgi:hypothetical protein